MSETQGQRSIYSLISAGPDWLTATAKLGGPSLEFEDIARRVFDEERTAGGDVQPAVRFGYVGLAADGFFSGRRTDDVCIVLSGPRSTTLFASVTQASTNVSRLDIQASVWTHGETPHLGIQGYNEIRRRAPRSGRKGQVTLMTSQPKGETLAINKRASDEFGRLYDKASESSLGEARTVWRYEVEYKRHRASALAHHLATVDTVESRCARLVHDWFRTRRITPTYNHTGPLEASGLRLEPPERDVLRWFERSVRVTIEKAAAIHGWPAVIHALGLHKRALSFDEEEHF